MIMSLLYIVKNYVNKDAFFEGVFPTHF